MMIAIMIVTFAMTSPGPRELRDAVRSRAPDAQACFDQAKDPELPLRLVIELVIDKAGKVRSAHEKTEPPYPSDAVVECVLNVVERIAFGPLGKPALVRHPFKFAASPGR